MTELNKTVFSHGEHDSDIEIFHTKSIEKIRLS